MCASSCSDCGGQLPAIGAVVAPAADGADSARGGDAGGRGGRGGGWKEDENEVAEVVLEEVDEEEVMDVS